MVQEFVRTLKRLGLLLLLAGLLAACASREQVAVPTLEAPIGIPAQDALNGTPAAELLTSADQAATSGGTQAAGLYLERALRIAPASSWLYKRMADLLLTEGKAQAAEGFARHALSNAPASDKRYRASLLQLLATCLAHQGRAEEAAQLRQQASQLLGSGSG